MTALLFGLPKALSGLVDRQTINDSSGVLPPAPE